MKPRHFKLALFCPLLAVMPFNSAWAGTFGTASASADGESACSQAASGTSGGASCMGTYPPGYTGFAQADFGGTGFDINAQVQVGNGALGYRVSASAMANVTFDEWVIIIGGSGPGTLTGTYSFGGLSNGDFGPDPFTYSIDQGGVGSVNEALQHSMFDLTAVVTSSFIYDDAFELTETLSDYASTPGRYHGNCFCRWRFVR